MVTNIGHIALKVNNIEKSVDFYVNALGLKKAFEFHKADGSLSGVYLYIAPGQFIELFPNAGEEYTDSCEKVSYSHLCFEVPNAKAEMEEMRAKGVIIDADLKVGLSKCIQFWVHDPDGNKIELMELPPDSLQAKANKKFENK